MNVRIPKKANACHICGAEMVEIAGNRRVNKDGSVHDCSPEILERILHELRNQKGTRRMRANEGIHALFAGKCALCSGPIAKGELITGTTHGRDRWAHLGCWQSGHNAGLAERQGFGVKP
jgi:hypothetical protein